MYFQDAFDGLERLKDLCPAIPVHCIFGKRIDMVYVHRRRQYRRQLNRTFSLMRLAPQKCKQL